jgi:hypothetical protein
MTRVTTGNARPHMHGTKPASMRLRVIGMVVQQRLRPAVRAATLAAHRWHRLQEESQLRAVVAVGACDVRSQWHALPVSEDMGLAVSFALVHGARSCLLACMDGTHRRRVRHCSRAVNAVGTVQPGPQLSVQLVPHACSMPVAKAPPIWLGPFALKPSSSMRRSTAVSHGGRARADRTTLPSSSGHAQWCARTPDDHTNAIRQRRQS